MFEKQIALGVEFLNKHKGTGWVKEIDLGILNMGSCSYDILGQLYGDYGASPLGSDYKTLIELGFGDNGSRYKELGAEWRETITKLLKGEESKMTSSFYVDCVTNGMADHIADVADEKGWNEGATHGSGGNIALFDTDRMSITWTDSVELTNYEKMSIEDFLKSEGPTNTFTLGDREIEFDKDNESVDIDGEGITFEEADALLEVVEANPDLLNYIDEYWEQLVTLHNCNFSFSYNKEESVIKVGCQEFTEEEVGAFREKFDQIRGE